MVAPPSRGRRPRAVVFDLDEVLIDSRRAWQYALEEAIAATTGQRTDAGRLSVEYRRRPWRDALLVLTGDDVDRRRCAALCEEMFRRSALKRLLVHDGMGMALDRLRGGQIEMGALSREPHRDALTQIESTGLDRFFSVLSPTAAGAAWDPAERFLECVQYLGARPTGCAFVSGDFQDLHAVQDAGGLAVEAAWAAAAPTGFPRIDHPDTLERDIRQLFRG